MCNNFLKQFLLSCALSSGAHFFVAAQQKMPVFPGAIKEKREAFYKTIVSKNINAGLASRLNAANEFLWISAFESVNLVKYHSAFVNAKIDFAADHLAGRSNDFKKEFLQLINSDYPEKYRAQVKSLLNNTDDPLLFAMEVNYLLHTASANELKMMEQLAAKRLLALPEDAVLQALNMQLNNISKKMIPPSLSAFFDPAYLPGQVIVFSFQRKNRNFPGLAMVRASNGKMLKNDDGTFFSVGQLARSESNMPGYISLGNTPQGIFRMDGFDTSKNFFIGPTTNIQLTLPFEFKASHFFRDSSLADNDWQIKRYSALLPENFRNDEALSGTWYAGKAGRNELIAHGTTIDPAYYQHTGYGPYSPSAGCLVAKEKWNEQTGMLQSSDELLLSEAVKKAGGAKGYLIVIETGDKQFPVSVNDIRPYIPK